MEIFRRAKKSKSKVMDALHQMDKALMGLSDKEKLQAISLLKRSFELEMLAKSSAEIRE